MATTYYATLTILNDDVDSTFDYYNANQITGGAGGPVAGVLNVLDILEESYASNLGLGGSFSITETVGPIVTTYNITYSGLTVDPATTIDINYGVPNEIVNFTLQSPQYAYGGRWISAEACIDEDACPECPPSVNPEDAEDCLTCYNDEVEFCADDISVPGLESNTEYNFKIVDNSTGNVYTYTATSDNYGAADLVTEDFPRGLFTPYNGPFTITITDINGDPVTLTYGYVNYSCISVTITKSNDYTP